MSFKVWHVAKSLPCLECCRLRILLQTDIQGVSGEAESTSSSQQLHALIVSDAGSKYDIQPASCGIMYNSTEISFLNYSSHLCKILCALRDDDN
jgi:hypothetical protein